MEGDFKGVITLLRKFLGNYNGSYKGIINELKEHNGARRYFQGKYGI